MMKRSTAAMAIFGLLVRVPCILRAVSGAASAGALRRLKSQGNAPRMPLRASARGSPWTSREACEVPERLAEQPRRAPPTLPQALAASAHAAASRRCGPPCMM